MKVRAIQQGFIYGIFRHPGSVIELRDPEKEFSENWMEKVAEGTQVVLTGPPSPRPEDVLGDSPLVPKNTPIPLSTLESFDVASQPVKEEEPAEGTAAEGSASGDEKVL